MKKRINVSGFLEAGAALMSTALAQVPHASVTTYDQQFWDKTREKNAEAFTLVELLVVIAIIAILAGLLLPC